MLKTGFVALGVAGVLLAGCGMGPPMFLGARDREIASATETIEKGGTATERAKAYVQRGHAYSEKARYTRVMNLANSEECERWFAQAIKDHDQAVTLDPNNSNVYYMRGHAYLDRGGNELLEKKDARATYDLAAADFMKAIENDSSNYLAWDRLGMVYMSTAQYDEAITVFKQEMALNEMGKARLADAYCNRGSAKHRAQKLEAAIADYEKSIEVGANPDSCQCNPRLPLAELKKAATR